MRVALAAAFALLAAGCAGPGQTVVLRPCPPTALPVCHAAAQGCEAAPFCYRTLGRVECYETAETTRATVEEIVPPAACRAQRLAPAG